ncbi:MAG: glycosyltransferase, partial [Burkholderiales bacterium]|nr:glycosyltransferase [Anaerolineae bacterium]
PDDFLIAHFGFLKQGKGLETLLDGVASLHQAGVPVRLMMIGGRTSTNEPTDADYAAEVDQRIETLGISPLVHWTGYINDGAVGVFLAASDVVVLPFSDGASYRSGSLMAALLYGGAIVTTIPRTETPAFIDSENMLLFPPSDSAALTRSLQRLYDSPELRQRLRQGARQLARQFDWSQIAKDHVAFFQRIKATV